MEKNKLINLKKKLSSESNLGPLTLKADSQYIVSVSSQPEAINFSVGETLE